MKYNLDVSQIPLKRIYVARVAQYIMYINDFKFFLRKNKTDHLFQFKIRFQWSSISLFTFKKMFDLKVKYYLQLGDIVILRS